MGEVFLRKLERLGRLTDGERRLVEAAELVPKQIEADHDLMREGEHPSKFVMLLDGFACRYRTIEDGRRQILAFHVPGDLCDLAGLHLKRLDCGTRSLTSVTVVLIPHATLFNWSRFQPRLSELLWRATLVDTAISREWIVNVGRRSAYQRTGHLLCEIVLRMRFALGMPGPFYNLPFTQVALADALGLTAVHVSRMLQQLRTDGLAELSGGVLTVLNWRGLKQAADFDPSYLHQNTASGTKEVR